MTEVTKTEIKNLKPNGFIVIDGAPCRVEKVQVSTSGKHGASKVRVEAIGLLDDKRRSIVAPSDEEVEVPIILKKNAQVIAFIGEKVQLMDLNDFSTFELEIPEELKGKIEIGKEIQYFEVLGIKTLKQIK